MRRLLTISAICLIIFCSNSNALRGNGSVSTELYSFEQDTLKYYQLYQSIQSQLVLSQNGQKRVNLSSYGRFRSGLDNKFDSDPQLFVYNFQLSFKEYIKSTKFSLGRQYVYTTVGSALVDGLSLKSTIIPNSEISLHAGSEVDRLDPEKIQNMSENLVVGFRFGYNFKNNIKVGLNWFLRNNDSQVTAHRLGIDTYKKFDIITLYSRYTYNMYLKTSNEFLIRGSLNKNKWYISAEGRYREPLVNSNSIFAIIDSEKYKRVRFDIQYKLNRKSRLISQVRYALYEDDNSVSGSVGFRVTNISLFYNYQTGRGTKNNGFSGTITHSVNKVTSIYASVNLSRYKIQNDYDELSDSYATALGVVRTISNNWQVRGEWQYLRNAVESSNSRIYLKLSKNVQFGR